MYYLITWQVIEPRQKETPKRGKKMGFCPPFEPICNQLQQLEQYSDKTQQN